MVKCSLCMHHPWRRKKSSKSQHAKSKKNMVIFSISSSDSLESIAELTMAVHLALAVGHLFSLSQHFWCCNSLRFHKDMLVIIGEITKRIRKRQTSKNATSVLWRLWTLRVHVLEGEGVAGVSSGVILWGVGLVAGKENFLVLFELALLGSKIINFKSWF